MTTVRALSAGADGERRWPSPFLHGKIMSGIRASQRLESPPARWRLGWRAVAGTVCLLFVTGVIWMSRPPAPGSRGSGGRLVPAEGALALNLPSAAQVDQWTKTLDGPLEHEMELVLNDAQAAINSLKASFLPENAAGWPPNP